MCLRGGATWHCPGQRNGQNLPRPVAHAAHDAEHKLPFMIQPWTPSTTQCFREFALYVWHDRMEGALGCACATRASLVLLTTRMSACAELQVSRNLALPRERYHFAESNRARILARVRIDCAPEVFCAGVAMYTKVGLNMVA